MKLYFDDAVCSNVVVKMPLEFTSTSKGKKQLIHNNFTFYEYYRSKNLISWRCSEYKKKCLAKLHTTSDKRSGQIIDEDKIINHNHVVDKCDLEALKVKKKMKKLAKNTSESSMVIISNSTANISASTSAHLPLNKSLCRTIQRERAKVLGGPALPTNFQDLKVPEMFQKTLRGAEFLYEDYNSDAKRIQIYTTKDNLNILKKCSIWQGDGTFDPVPEIFDQLYTIHGRYKGHLIPLVYINTTDRTIETYKHILRKLIEFKSGLKPTTMIVDFEWGFIHAMNDIFPNCDIHGCYFHWIQCIWRHLQKFGMSSRYMSDEEFSYQIRMLLSLAFVQPCDVVSRYDMLINSEYWVNNNKYLAPLIEYFEPTWIINRSRRRCNSPRFSIDIWNCYKCVQENIPRTNNGIEGWNRGFSTKINQSHASIWKYLKAIQLEQSLIENKISDIKAKKIVLKPNKKYSDLDKRISAIIDDYDKYDDLEFLESIALNVRF